MICDADMILRYVLDDDAVLSSKAAESIEHESMVLDFEIILQVVYVLEKLYSVDRDEIHETVVELSNYPNIEILNKQAFFDALFIFHRSKLDFMDIVNTLRYGYYSAEVMDIGSA